MGCNILINDIDIVYWVFICNVISGLKLIICSFVRWLIWEEVMLWWREIFRVDLKDVDFGDVVELLNFMVLDYFMLKV